ncbi:MAG: DMT family transporter [Hyphomicrobiales bacterium]
MGLAEWAMVIALSLVWGGSFFFVGVAVKEVPTFTIVVSRVVIAAAALWLVVIATGVKVPKDGRVWAAFFGMGALNNAIPFCLIVWGQAHIASGLASILNATTPMFTVLVAHYWTADEKLTPTRIAGVLVGFAGVVVMIGGDVFSSLGVNVFAQLAILGAALSYAFAGVYGRRFKTMGVDPVMTATGQVTASSLLLLPVMLVIDKPWTLAIPSAATIACLLALAILSTALAYILYFRILAAAGATNLLIVTFLVPVSAILLGVAFLNEVIESKRIIGMALIGLGLAFIDGRLFRFRGQRQPAQ